MRGAVVVMMIVVGLCLLAGAADAQLGQRDAVPSVTMLIESATDLLERPAEAATDGTSCRDADAPAGTVSSRRLAAALTCLIEEARSTRNLADLRRSSLLRRAASRHAHDMQEHGFFSHRSSNGDNIGARAKAVGYANDARQWEVGEALHWGEGTRSSPHEALKELLHSPAHRAILLSHRLHDIGVAAFTRRTVATYVVDMGRRS
jgi:uncharacterized protein YkwD